MMNEIEDLEARIASLEREIAAANKKAERLRKQCCAQIQTIITFKRERDEARKVLFKYGKHTPMCNVLNYIGPRECDCGWEQAIFLARQQENQPCKPSP